MIEFLAWDSALFGYKIGELIIDNQDIRPILKQAKAENYRLLYARLSPSFEQHQSLIQNGGKLVDEKINFRQKIIDNQLISLNSTAEIYETELLTEDLKNLALQSGLYSRFKLDSEFKNQEFEKLYTIWIENSVKKLIAEKIIIQKKQGKIVGLLTLGLKNNRADIGLLAVDKAYQNLGIGSQLIYKALIESYLMKQNIIQVVSQKANQKACNFYQKMGFEIERTENIYHFWL